MSRPALSLLAFGLGVLAAQFIAIGGVLAGDWWAERVARG